ncbi:MAG: hypothetical protein K2N18_05260, partial [Clostridia bacterium]|nr:hypothetical protein [Clostridia bacterium]
MVKNRKLSVIAIVLLIVAFVLSSVILSLGGIGVINAFNSTTNLPPTSIGSLTFTDYETLTNGAVFDASILDNLYGIITQSPTGKDTYTNALNEVQGSTSTLYSKVDGNDNYPMTETESMNYSQLKAANGGEAITVEFGGYTWNVVYVTANTNDSTVAGRGDAGDLIATLWMSDVDLDMGDTYWTNFVSNVTTGKYAATEYGISEMRMETLNCGDINGGETKYAKDTGKLIDNPITKETRAAHPYAKFTLTNAALTAQSKNSANGNMSLVDYLATPSQVSYQEKENYIWSAKHVWATGFLANEAWGNPDSSLTLNGSSAFVNGWFKGNSGNGYATSSMLTHDNYYAWAEDYIWLPSITETGYSGRYDTSLHADSIGTSLWGIPNDDGILQTSGSYWSRSGEDHSWASNATHLYMQSSAAKAIYNLSRGKAKVRPALHLNLTKAQANAKYRVSIPNTVSTTYNGDEQGVEDQAWFKAFGTGGISVEYYDKETTSKFENSKPIEVGTYQAKLTITGTKHFWATGSETDPTRSIDFKITQKKIDFPTFDVGKQPYSGGSTVVFYLSEMDDDVIDVLDISVPTGDSKYDDVIYHPNNLSVTAINAGTYTLNVKLTDTKNYAWKTTYNKLECEVLKAPVNMAIDDGHLKYVLTGDQGKTIKANLIIDTSNTALHAGKSVTGIIMAYRSGSTRGTPIGEIVIDNSNQNGSIPLSLDLTDLRVNYSYTVGIEIDATKQDGGNYKAVMSQVTTLNVTDPNLRNNITWRVVADGTVMANMYAYSEVGETSKTYDGDPIYYNGKKYTFDATAPNGYTIDKNFGVGGYLVSHTDTNNSNVGVNVDSYTTTIQIIEDATNKKTEYTLSWQIEKALFDLTNVKWLNDGKVEYNDGNDVSPSLDPKTLPEGLVPHYSGVTVGNNVGIDGGTAGVYFTLDTGYEDFYELPADGGKDTNYIFKGEDDFKWEILWEVAPAIIKLEWEEKEVTDANGNLFNVLVLKDKRVDGKVDYLYYPCDNRGTIDPSKSALTEDEILVSATDRQYFKAYPTLRSNYADNYSFPAGTTEEKRYSSVFAVGGGSSSVKVSLETDRYEYNNGKPIKLKVSIDGTATLAQLSLTYYEGDVIDEDKKLDGAPSEVGKYLVVIKSTTATVVLGGKTQYEFDVVQSRVAKNWKMEAKPPVLELKYGQINGVEYEIIDSAGNPVTDISKITPGDYKIKAKIKDTKNYIFADDTYETDYVDFSIREGDAVYDPNSSSNPHYPQVDPDDPSTVNPGDNGGGKEPSFIDKLLASHFPLWQVIVMAVSAILAIIFIAKAAQYGSRAKQAKNDTKKISAKTYASLLPVFSSEAVALGLSNKLWSIMAFAFAG